ncbi:type I DNA topoisomerase [Candidatus Saccharibacteria bacterium]|nr:type I DNA topoisomerase [Candidatus Saccharibacteria bacterium]
MKLVIVESPAKAKTIEKYLGKEYKVMSSVGHIRQIAKGNAAVDVNKDFKVTYEIEPSKAKLVGELRAAVAKASEVLLATDEDREGEAISWHLTEVLGLPKNTKRITFNEITKTAIERALKNPRKVDMAMVSSQQTRQTLDRLVGFELSPVVWKKVPGGKSAGRVQSPAVRLVVEREREIEAFSEKSVFKVRGEFTKGRSKDVIKADLKEALETEAEAEKLLEKLVGVDWAVEAVEQNPGVRKPAPPFTTASLQIEANAKLGFSARTTMSAAQGLYQAGHISYHRTDSLNLSGQFLAAAAGWVEDKYGKDYVRVRKFSTKAAGAQEAHEAVRPTQVGREVAGKNDYEKRLYGLIWRRAVASQMAEAKLEKTVVKVVASNKTAVLEATGEVITFPGFMEVYGRPKESELPVLAVGDALDAQSIVARQSFMRPPSRYTEGSLVKKLEELAIGRPSTYATIMSTIQEREYVKRGTGEGVERAVIELRLDGKKVGREIVTEKTGSDNGKLVPNVIGEILTDFLTKYFDMVVDYGFTAKIEEDLDKIAEKETDRLTVLNDFYKPFHELVVEVDEKAERMNNATLLGTDPKSGLPIYGKVGRNGEFLQLGETVKGGEKPRFIPLPEGKTLKTVTLEDALKQVALPALPRLLGEAKDGKEIWAAKGPFGPFLKVGDTNVSMKEDPFKVTLAKAQELYQAKLDSIIADWGEIKIINGAYGPYVKGPGKFNTARVPKETDPKTLTEADAKKLLDEKPARGGGGWRGRKAATGKAKVAKGSSRGRRKG